MRLKASELATLLNGRLSGNPDVLIEGVATFEDATPKDVTFISDAKYEKKISSTQAGVIICDKDYGLDDRALIIVSEPRLAFATLLEYIQKEKSKNTKILAGIHPSAVISEDVLLGRDVSVGPCVVIEKGVKIGDGSVIGAGSYIGEDSRIGKNTVIHPNVVIYDNCVIGDEVVIHSSSVIGSDGFGYIPAGKVGIKKVPQIGIVRIENRVEIGSNVSIDRATVGATVIDDETKIDNLSHIAHNVKIGKRCLIAAGAGIAGSVVIGDDVIIGGQVGVRDHVRIGNKVTIAARSGVIGDVKDGQTVSGFPARPHTKMMKLYALIEKLPEILERIKKLESR